MLSHAAWHRQVMAIKGRVGWAGGEQHEKKAGCVLLTIQTWRWQPRVVKHFSPPLLFLHTFSVVFSPEVSGQWGSAYRKLNWLDPRVPGLRSLPELWDILLAQSFSHLRWWCWMVPARVAILRFQSNHPDQKLSTRFYVHACGLLQQ